MVSVKLVRVWHHTEHQCAHHNTEPWKVAHVQVFSTGQLALLLSENASSKVRYDGHGNVLECHTKLQLCAHSLSWLDQSRFCEHFYRSAHLV